MQTLALHFGATRCQRAAAATQRAAAPLRSPLRHGCRGAARRTCRGAAADGAALILSERRRFTREVSDAASLDALGVPAPDDFYRLLRVAPGASFAEVKAAYRKIAKAVHPDVVGEAAHSLAIVLNLANAVLTDEHTRRAYDDALREWRAAAGSFDGQPVSEWRGAEDEEMAIFVDECACIGCRKCVNVAPDTFALEEDFGAPRSHTWQASRRCSCLHPPAAGRARVHAQWGDNKEVRCATLRTAAAQRVTPHI
jgi:hypothetical protein